mmetsp:Transcript_21865/g.47588  ORF Transcript_21865/g.47588 Transcript_21865/m.47588 type:complete len:246 (-) Transcript_21865:810-1547(-)
MFGILPVNKLLSMYNVSSFFSDARIVMDPPSLFFPTLKSIKLVRLPSHSGRFPSNLLPSRNKPVKWVILERLGNVPVRYVFRETEKYLSFVSCVNQPSGIGPWNWLCARFKMCSSVKPLYSTGSVPTISFPLTNRSRNLESLPSDAGSLWLHLLSRTSRTRSSSKADNSSGIWPSILFSWRRIPVTRLLASYVFVKGVKSFSAVDSCSRGRHSTPCHEQIPFSVIQLSELVHPPASDVLRALVLL